LPRQIGDRDLATGSEFNIGERNRDTHVWIKGDKSFTFQEWGKNFAAFYDVPEW
jgi:hypothetical protein